MIALLFNCRTPGAARPCEVPYVYSYLLLPTALNDLLRTNAMNQSRLQARGHGGHHLTGGHVNLSWFRMGA